MQQIPCPDGYLIEAGSPLADGHHALNQYLLRVEEAGWQKALKEINGTRNKALKLNTWKALLERMRWLGEYNPASTWWSPLRGLAERIEKWTLSTSETDLIEILDLTALVKDLAAPYTPIPHLMTFVEERGLTPELSHAIRRFRDRVWEQHYTPNRTSLQLFRSRLDMLGWRDEWNPVDLKSCWSARIRADFRSMHGEERENWRRLLFSIHGDEGVRPTARWLELSRTLIERIGAREFRKRLNGWLEPLKPGCTQRLSREASYILRSFIWLVESSKDPELLNRVCGICEVDFKPKSNAQKVIRAAAEATGKPDPTVRPPAPILGLDGLVARALEAVLSLPNSLLCQAFGEIERGRSADIVAQVIIEPLLELGVVACGFVVLGELTQRIHQGFGNVASAVGTESAMLIGNVGGCSRHIG
jgi:hypothetical protein